MPPLPANVNECLIRVQCNIAQMLIDGRAGVLQFRVINEHEHKVSVQLDAFSEIIPRPGLSKRSPPIEPNNFKDLPFQLNKNQVEAGTYVIDLRVSVDSVGGDKVSRCYSAEFLYEVIPAPVPGAPVNITVHNDNGVRQADQGGQAGIIESKSQINNNIKIEGGQRAYSEGPTMSRDPSWHEITLTPIELNPRPEAAVKAPPSASRPTSPVREMRLECLRDTWSLLVLSKETLSIGRGTRQSTGADLVVWKLPRSHDNDRQTTSISRQHLLMRFERHGVSAQPFANGDRDPRVITKQEVVDVAGVLALTVTPLPTPKCDASFWNHWRTLANPDAAPKWNDPSAPGGCLVEWPGAASGTRLRCLWIRTAVEVDRNGMPCFISRKAPALILLALPHLAIADLPDRRPDAVMLVESDKLDGSMTLEGNGWQIGVTRYRHHTT